MVWGLHYTPLHSIQGPGTLHASISLCLGRCPTENKHRYPLSACLSSMRTHKNGYMLNGPEKPNRKLSALPYLFVLRKDIYTRRICIHLPQLAKLVCTHVEERSEYPQDHFTGLTGEGVPPNSSY